MTPQSDWLERWQAQSASDLTAALAAIAAPEPESWAASELRENIAQTARYLFLRGVWRRLIETVGEGLDGPMAARLRAVGADDETMARLLRSALYSFAFETLYLIDEPVGTLWSTEPRRDLEEGHPRWALVELAPDGHATGRDVGGLHESLMEAAPADIEADDWVRTR